MDRLDFNVLFEGVLVEHGMAFFEKAPPATMSTSSCIMTVRTANRMFNAMLRFFANAFLSMYGHHREVRFAVLGGSPKSSSGNGGPSCPEKYAISVAK